MLPYSFGILIAVKSADAKIYVVSEKEKSLFLHI